MTKKEKAFKTLVNIPFQSIISSALILLTPLLFSYFHQINIVETERKKDGKIYTPIKL